MLLGYSPIAHYSENWQLIINTGTTIITFLMVFILNNAQSRDTKAIDVELDSLIRAVEKAEKIIQEVEAKTRSASRPAEGPGRSKLCPPALACMGTGV